LTFPIEIRAGILASFEEHGELDSAISRGGTILRRIAELGAVVCGWDNERYVVETSTLARLEGAYERLTNAG
jgi:hypothetical protein